MDLTGLIVLGFLWFLFNVVGKGRRSQERSRPMPPGPRSGTGNATQREGSRLEALLRELERRVEDPDAKPGPRGRPATVALPPAEEVEERESLEAEAEAEVVSLEQVVRRPARVRVDRDEEVAGIEAARVAAAEARSGALTRKDHTAFDTRIRQEAADATAVRPLSPERLREAMIWREILGAPLSLRDRDR